MNSKRAIALTGKDNVAVAFEHIEPGDTVTIEVKGGTPITLESAEAVPFGFKIALENIPKRGHVVKYGEVIGCATSDIIKGAQVHVHNIEGVRVQVGDKEGEGA